MKCYPMGIDSDLSDMIEEIIEELEAEGKIVAQTKNGYYIVCEDDD